MKKFDFGEWPDTKIPKLKDNKTSKNLTKYVVPMLYQLKKPTIEDRLKHVPQAGLEPALALRRTGF